MSIPKKELDELTTRMVHDVRTPLTILNMVAVTLESKTDGSNDAKEELNILKEEVAKIEKLITTYRDTLRKKMK